MTPRQEAFSIVVCVVLLAVIAWLVRQRRLSEYHSGLWLVFGVGLLVMVLWYDALQFLARLAGAVVVTTAVFITAFLFLVAVSIHTSTELTRLHRLVRTLAQELALLEARLKEPPDARPPLGHSVEQTKPGSEEHRPWEGMG